VPIEAWVSRPERRSSTAGSADGATVRFRGGGFTTGSYPVAAAATLFAVILAWHVAAGAQRDFTFLPSPGDVLEALVELWRTGELMRHATASLGRLAAGWLIGAGCGLAIGLAIGLYPIVRSSALPVVSALFATPKIALLPLFVVWFGIGEASKIATIAIGVFSPMVVATYSGVDGVDRGLIRMAQSFGLPTGSIVRKILLPGAMPSLLTGIRVSASIAIVLLTGAEMIAAQHGIGALALTSGNLMRTDRLFAALALLAGCGLAISWAVALAERALLQWR
jgi:ABC-type nitrate/sulfonate/bicarbonate transport system permease component